MNARLQEEIQLLKQGFSKSSVQPDFILMKNQESRVIGSKQIKGIAQLNQSQMYSSQTSYILNSNQDSEVLRKQNEHLMKEIEFLKQENTDLYKQISLKNHSNNQSKVDSNNPNRINCLQNTKKPIQLDNSCLQSPVSELYIGDKSGFLNSEKNIDKQQQINELRSELEQKNKQIKSLLGVDNKQKIQFNQYDTVSNDSLQNQVIQKDITINHLQKQIQQLINEKDLNLLNNGNNLDMSFLNQSSILMEDDLVMPTTTRDRLTYRQYQENKEKEIMGYKKQIEQLLSANLQRKEDIIGMSILGDAESLKSENACLKAKVDSLQKELQNKFNVKQQQSEFQSLLQSNQKLMQENAQLTQLNRKLMDEIDIMKNSSQSQINLSNIYDRRNEIDEIQNKLDKQTKINQLLQKQMKEMQENHEQVIDLHNQSMSSILNPSTIQQKSSLTTLLATNQKIIEENAQLSQLNKKLMEEIDNLKNNTQSQLDISNVYEKASEAQSNKRKLDQQTQLNQMLLNQMKDLKENYERLMEQQQNESMSNILHSLNEGSTPSKSNQLTIVMETNKKLIVEMTQLSEMNKKLMDEIEYLKNVSHSRLDISHHGFEGVEIENLKSKLEKQNGLNEALMNQMKEMKQNYEETLKKQSEQGSSNIQVQLQLQKQKQSFSEQVSKLEELLKKYQDRISELEKELNESQNSRKKLELKQQQSDNNKIQFESVIKTNQNLSEQVMNLQTQNNQLHAELDDLRNRSMYQSGITDRSQMNFMHNERIEQLMEENRILAEQLVALSKVQRNNLPPIDGSQNVSKNEAIKLHDLQEQNERILRVNQKLLSDNLDKGEKEIQMKYQMEELKSRSQLDISMSYIQDDEKTKLCKNLQEQIIRYEQDLIGLQKQLEELKVLQAKEKESLKQQYIIEKENLKNQYNKDSVYLNNELESIRSQNLLLQNDLYKKSEEGKQIQEQITSEVQKQNTYEIAILKAQIIQLNDEITKKNMEIEMNITLNKSTNQIQNDLEIQVLAKNNQIQQLQEQMLFLERENIHIQKQFEQSRALHEQQIISLKEQQKIEFESQQNQLNQQVYELQMQIKQLCERNERLANQNQELYHNDQEEKEQFEYQIRDLNERLEEQSKDISQKQILLEQYKYQIEENDQKIAQNMDNYINLQNQYENISKLFEKTQNEKIQLEQQYNSFIEDNQNVGKSLTNEVKKQKDLIERQQFDINENNKNLQEKINIIQQLESSYQQQIQLMTNKIELCENELLNNQGTIQSLQFQNKELEKTAFERDELKRSFAQQSKDSQQFNEKQTEQELMYQKLNEYEQKNKRLEEKIKEYQKEKESLLNDLIEKAKRFQSEIIQHEEKLRLKENECLLLKEECNQQNQTLIQQQNKNEILTDQIYNLTYQLNDRMKQNLSEEELNEQNQNLIQKYKEQTEMYNRQAKLINEHEEKIHEQMMELNNLRQMCEQALNDQTSLKSKYEEILVEHQNKQSSMEQQSQINEYKLNYNKLLQENQHQQELINKLKIQIYELEQVIENIEQKQSNNNSREQQNNLIKQQEQQEINEFIIKNKQSEDLANELIFKCKSLEEKMILGQEEITTLTLQISEYQDKLDSIEQQKREEIGRLVVQFKNEKQIENQLINDENIKQEKTLSELKMELFKQFEHNKILQLALDDKNNELTLVQQQKNEEIEEIIDEKEKQINQLITQKNILAQQTLELSNQVQKLQEEVDLNRSSYSHNSSFQEE